MSALFTTARKWEQPECLSADEWINEIWEVHGVEYYLTIKNNADRAEMCHNIGELRKYARWKKLVTKEHILPDSFYVKRPEERQIHRDRK